jgi:hypothetical protein
MFTRHEIFKHMMQEESDSGGDSSDDDFFHLMDEDGDDNDGNEDQQESKVQRKRSNISINLHLVDRSFVPNSSSLTRLEPIDPTPQERVLKLCIGIGSQTFRWLALTARARLHQLYHREGLVRQRERVLGRMGSFLPTSITSEDPETDGEFLEPDTVLNTVVEDGDHLWLNFDQAGGSTMTNWERKAFFNHPHSIVETTPKIEDNTQQEKQSRPVLRASKPSVFLARKFESDSHDYYDSAELLSRAFQSDWTRWKSKPMFLKKVDADVKRNSFRHYSQLRAVFRFFASSGAGEPFTMSMNEFVNMTRQCKIPEHSLGILWKVSNFNPDDPKSTDHVLERHEFLEILMRLASELYIEYPRAVRQQHKHSQADATNADEDIGEKKTTEEGKKTSSMTTSEEKNNAVQEEKNENIQEVAENMDNLKNTEEDEDLGAIAGVREEPKTMAEAIDCLIRDHIHEHCWNNVKFAEVMYADPDAFRRERLYFEEVNETFLEFSDELLIIYETYAQKSALRLREFNSALKLICYQEFEDVLQSSGIISSGDVLSVMDCRRSFVFAQMTCANIMNRSRRERSHDSHNRGTFVEFCEALARMCDLGAAKNNNTELLPALSTALGTFLQRMIDGLGSEFWKHRRNKGHYDRTVTKKFGKRRQRGENGPEVGRYELDSSLEAVRFRLQLRKKAVTKLPRQMSFLSLKLPIDISLKPEAVEVEPKKGRRK